MNKKYLRLEEEGFPHIRLYRSGRIYNANTERFFNTVGGHKDIVDRFNLFAK